MNNIVSKKGPFIKDNNSTFKMMRNLFIALLPIILFTFYKNGYLPYKNGDTDLLGLFYPLIFILIPTLLGFITELLYSLIIKKKRKKELIHEISSSFSIFPGLFLGLILPINTPISILIMGSLFATIIGKLVYGGFGHNIFNPALVGRIFVITTYALTITNNGGYLNPSELDAVTKATPLSNIVEGIGTYDTLVKPYGSLMDFFIGTIPGAVGETSVILCIIGFIYLTFKKVIKWRIPVIYITTVFIMTFLIGLTNNVGIWYPLFQILSGGLMFGAVFMATDPVTSPVTKQGQIIYALMLGLLTVVFRYLTPYPEGVLTSILTMNMLVFILDKIGLKAKKEKKHFILPLSIIILLIIGVSIYIGNSFDNKKSDVNIISKEKVGNNTTYVVTTKGYVGNIKVEVVVSDKKVEKYTVLEQNESFYQTVENANYINTLLNNQSNLEKLDTVTGATVTSTALKKILLSVIDDYTNGKGFDVEVTPQPQTKDFEIISKEEIDEKVVYIVTQKSFGGKMKLEVTTENHQITNIEVLEKTDTYFYKLEQEDYINKVINVQGDLEELSSVAGATISSNAFKTAITNILEDLNNPEQPEEETPKDFEIISKKEINEKVVYTVTQKSFGGKMKLEVTLVDNEVTNIKVLEKTDSYFYKLENIDYINKVIENQNDLENLDTVTGATISSKSLKEAIKNILDNAEMEN